MARENAGEDFGDLRELFRDIARQFQELRQSLEQMSQEADRRAREADQRAQEADRRAQEEADRRAQEADQRAQEENRRAQEENRRAQEADQQAQAEKQRSQELDRRFKETDQKIKELSTLFTGQWGRLIEALVEPGSVELFRNRGVNVTTVAPRVKSKRNGGFFEIDLLLENDDAIVIIEVKSTLRVQDVREFADEKLNTFFDFFPKYKGYEVYGAVAGVQINEGVEQFAYNSGLFVLGMGQEGLVRMLNDIEFEPRNFRRDE